MALHTWTATDQLSAADLNANFELLKSPRYETMTAGESLVAGNPLCVMPYPVADITLDMKDNAQTSGTSLTRSITVGNHADRTLVVFVGIAGNQTASCTYNGVSMTQQDTNNNYFNNPGNFYTFTLIAPATGTHNVVVSASGSATICCHIFSYYNTSQSAIDAHGIGGVQGTPAALAFSLTPTVNGSLVVGATNGSSPAGTILTNNTQSASGMTSGDSGALYPHSAQTITTSSGTFIVGAAISLAPVYAGSSARVYKTKGDVALRANSFIGFANASASAAAQVDVCLGGTDANQSSLVIGSHYYLGDTAASLSTSAGTVTRKVGTAISATTIAFSPHIW